MIVEKNGWEGEEGNRGDKLIHLPDIKNPEFERVFRLGEDEVGIKVREGKTGDGKPMMQFYLLPTSRNPADWKRYSDKIEKFSRNEKTFRQTRHVREIYEDDVEGLDKSLHRPIIAIGAVSVRKMVPGPLIDILGENLVTGEISTYISEPFAQEDDENSLLSKGIGRAIDAEREKAAREKDIELLIAEVHWQNKRRQESLRNRGYELMPGGFHEIEPEPTHLFYKRLDQENER